MAKVGQIYVDKDKRRQRRHLKVVEIAGLYVYLLPCTPGGAVHHSARRTRISLLNLEKRFYAEKRKG